MISKGVGYMIIATVFLAGQQVLVKELQTIPIAQIVLVRAFVSFILCSAVLVYTKESFIGKNPALLILRGVVGTASLLTFFYTLQNVPLASAVTIGHISPLFLSLLALFFLKERIAYLHVLSFPVCFAGVFLLKGFDPEITFFELGIALLSALLAATAHFTVKLLREEHVQLVLFYFSLLMIVLLSPYSLMHWKEPTNIQWALLVVLGIVSHTAQFFLTKSFKEEAASKVAMVSYLGIVIAVILGYYLYGELLSYENFLGILLILSGMFFSVLPKRISEVKI